MFYLRMAWRSLRRTRGLTTVMIVALSLGIGTWYAQRQIFKFLNHKIPTAQPHVYRVALERGMGPLLYRQSNVLHVPSILITPRDALGVLAGVTQRKTLTFGAPGLIEPAGKPAEKVRIRYTTRDLFELFEVALAAGAPWSATADAGLFDGTPTDEAVIDEQLARRFFGDPTTAIGNRLRIDGSDLRIVGVVAASHQDRYPIYERFAGSLESVYLPLSHATAARAEPDFRHVIAGGETGYLGVWVELPTEAARAAFLAHANAFLAGERASGRVATPRKVTLQSTRLWQALFAPAGTINLWPLLIGMCVATCIVNLIRMLMAKFADRRHDLGLLRAFGARRTAVIGQLMLEAMLIGLIAGACGLALGIAIMPVAMSTIHETPGTASVIDLGAVLTTFGVSIGAALIAAIYPAWRLSRGTPAVQISGGR